MNVLAWNCRGIGKDSAVQALKQLITQHRPSFIFLSETKVSDPDYMKNLRLELGYLNCDAVFSRGQSGGLALFWSDGIDVRFRSKSHHHIDVEVWERDGSGIAWRLSGFYGHPTTSESHRTWTLLRELSVQSALPWIVVGDFNEVLHASEKDGSCVRREGQMQQFRYVLAFCDLFDLGFSGSAFTWSRAGIRCRLDRAVGTASWTDIFPATRVSNLKPIHGDHVPIILGVHRSPLAPVQRRRKRFCFESFWVRHEACAEVVKSGWVCEPQNQPMLEVSQKIMHTRFALNDWQRNTFGCRRREIEFLRGRLQVLLDLPASESNQQESLSLSSKLDGLLAQEHDYWKQRAKITWLAEGEVDLSHMQSVVALVQPRVTPEMNSMLCAPYTATEIRVALFQMYPTKAPGPDGMPPLFFQRYWDTIGSNVVCAVLSFLHSGQLLASINYTHVCLIPKVKNPTCMSDLRPIALCNVIYKICSKVIANRLKGILSQIISPFQSAFIPGHLISDNTLIANEVSHFIHNNRSSSDGVMSLKLDMSKAYDRMEWVFLEAPRGYLAPTRGLRQGDQLSPYIFLLCTEVFLALLEHKATQGQLQGVQICSGAPIIHHLLFADDSLLFGKANLEECSHIQDVLLDYELASGQKVNFSKSSIVFSKKVCRSLQQLIAGSLGVVIVDKHDKYLGLPTYLGRNKTESFAYIQERLNKKLEGWQGKLLSSAGKDLLIRVVAQSLPSYTMSFFLLPKHLCDSLHRKCAKFWWGSKGENRKTHWLSWDRLCQPKEAGGMGFRDLHAHNLALLSKQGWRLIRNPGSLLARLYQARYFPNGDFWSSELSSSPSACWRGIHAAKHILRRGVRWQVLINQYFAPEDVDLILSISLSQRDVPDRLIWHYDKRGRFSTKSAYALAFSEFHDSGVATSHPGNISSFWKQIWFAQIPGKVKVHWWKVCSSILPTVAQLRTRRVLVQDGCWFCNDQDESINHITRDCQFVKDLLSFFPELHGVLQIDCNEGTSIVTWLASCFLKLSLKRMWPFYCLLDGLYGRSSHLVTTQSTSGMIRPGWSPPSSGWLKANCDGAFDLLSKSGGIGVVIRDALGDIVGGTCIKVTSVASPEAIEAMACSAACSLAVQYHLSPIIFETDCQHLVSSVESGGEETSPLGRVIKDINSFLHVLV
ncbi:uncharacterized protein LOC133722901 [Rosa rugosa]|uniref:uncharacterized protein LOC133722901 n=1 Tax=Rosa rugosa TaxID=74645 RepID=UPI002B40D52B|nr:uncharacterized protein LOC133722901 [Rosa rugosa]